jgi:hypothetical protein
MNQAGERFEQHSMALVTLEVPDSQEHAVVFIDIEFGAHSRGIAIGQRNAIRNDGEQRLVDPKLRRELSLCGSRHHHRVIGLAHCPTERDPPAQCLPHPESPVHGDHVPAIQQSRGGSTIHRHRELVAMDCVNVVLAKEVHQSAHATGIDRPLQSENLRREANAPEVVAEPTDSARWADGNDHVPSAPQFLGQAENHHFRPAWSVRLKHHCDAEARHCRHRRAIQRMVSFQNGRGSVHRRTSS